MVDVASLSHLYKIDRIPYFDILFSKVSYLIKLDACGQRRRLYETSLLVIFTAEIAELRRDKEINFYSAFSANSAVDSSGFFYDQTGRFFWSEATLTPACSPKPGGRRRDT